MATMERRLSTEHDDVVNQRQSFRLKGPQSMSAKATKAHPKSGCFGFCAAPAETEEADVVLVGGGIMSITVGLILQHLEPNWVIKCYERLGNLAEESTNGWNNAGTGHAALCEPNYTPAGPDGKIDNAKAIHINESWQLSRQLWASLVQKGQLTQDFMVTTPHVTFVQGEKDIEWLKERCRVLENEPLFASMKYSEDHDEIRSWSPLLVNGRDPKERIAASHVRTGTDVDFGAVTRGMANVFTENGGSVNLFHTVTGLKKIDPTKNNGAKWRVRVSKRDCGTGSTDVNAKFVFVGAGGWALPMLQKAGIPEIKGFGGFPISGEFLVCQKPEIVKQHNLKVYGKAAVGAPPMSVPHLDARVIDKRPCLLFGPYAGFSPRFLKTGNMMDLVKSIKYHNLIPMAAAGLANLDLTIYLIKELMATKKKRLSSLREFVPLAEGQDWALVTAGQRVQVMKKDKAKIGILQFGTEVVAHADGSICGLLGASPGASTAVQVALDVIKKCYPDSVESWTPKIKEIIPCYGTLLNKDATLAAENLAETARILGIDN